MSAIIGIDHRLCVGTGNCVLIAEELFDQDDERGQALLRRPGPVPPGLRDQAEVAVAACPVGALSWLRGEDDERSANNNGGGRP